MKKLLEVIAWVLGVLVLAAGSFAAYVAVTGIPHYASGNMQVKVEVTPDKVVRGRKLASLLCADCHLDSKSGKLTGMLMDNGESPFGLIYSKNITQDPDKGIGRWTDGEILYLLRTGIDRRGQYLPPYMVKLPLMSDDDLHSIVAFLRSDDPWVQAAHVDSPGVSRPSFLTKFLSHVAFKPLPYPSHAIATPPETDKVAYGRYLATNLGCYACHAADFKTMNELEPEKTPGYMGGGNSFADMNGDEVISANITFDPETGIGKWSEEDFDRALRTGVRPDRQAMRAPMAPLTGLSREDVGALYAYLQSVPKLAHAIPRPARHAPASASAGERVYLEYGCAGCHGKTGVGTADLRRATEHYPTDEQLIAWIKNPAAIKPDVKMPAWEGVIPEQEFPALVAYVRELGAKR